MGRDRIQRGQETYVLCGADTPTTLSTGSGNDMTNQKKGKITTGGMQGTLVDPLPDWVPRDRWEAFLKMRKSIKKPVQEDSIPRILQNLWRIWNLDSERNRPELVLNQSIDGNWQGLF